jgi:CRISPR-associated protein Cas2
MGLNGWRVMWVLAVFDCPVTTPEEVRAYTQFRKQLLRENFIQHQYSVYLKHFPTMAAAQAEIDRLKPAVPDGAHVAFFLLTDKQYGLTREFFGKNARKIAPDAPEQIELF